MATNFNVTLTVAMPPMNPKLPHLEVVTWVHQEGATGLNRGALYRSVIAAPAWDGIEEHSFTTRQRWQDSNGFGTYPSVGGLLTTLPMVYAPSPTGGTLPTFTGSGAPLQPVIGDPHHSNYSISPDIYFFEFRPVNILGGVDSDGDGFLEGGTLDDAGTSVFVAHYCIKTDWNGPTGYLGQHWPTLLPGDVELTPSRMDDRATWDFEMVDHFGNDQYSTSYEVREVDPIDLPLPWPMPPDGGTPTTNGAVEHLPNN